MASGAFLIRLQSFYRPPHFTRPGDKSQHEKGDRQPRKRLQVAIEEPSCQEPYRWRCRQGDWDSEQVSRAPGPMRCLGVVARGKASDLLRAHYPTTSKWWDYSTATR